MEAVKDPDIPSFPYLNSVSETPTRCYIKCSVSHFICEWEKQSEEMAEVHKRVTERQGYMKIALSCLHLLLSKVL